MYGCDIHLVRAHGEVLLLLFIMIALIFGGHGRVLYEAQPQQLRHLGLGHYLLGCFFIDVF